MSKQNEEIVIKKIIIPETPKNNPLTSPIDIFNLRIINDNK